MSEADPGDAGAFAQPPAPNVPPPSRAERGESGGGFAAPPDREFAAPGERRPPTPRDRAPRRAAAASVAQLQDDLLGLKRDIERRLAERVGNRSVASARATAEAFAVAPTGLNNVVGVGLGVAQAGHHGGTAARGDSEEGRDGPGAPALLLYVVEPVSEAGVRAAVANEMNVRAVADAATPVAMVVTGVIDARSHRLRLRPAPCGSSAGHFRVTAGTLGALARGRTGERRGRLLVLSNNHVLADCNDARVNDCVSQPGSADTGRCPADRIANLESWVTLDFAGGPNAVDAATAWAVPELVRRDFLYLQQGAPQYFRVGAQPGEAAVNLVVGKSGRTTQVTRGYVASVTATVTVDYGQGRLALFENQIEVRDLDGARFSDGGDSGSLVWSHDATRTPVGLLFAGGGQSTFVNHIDDVLDALDVDLFT